MENRVAIVTGAAMGQGADAAMVLAEMGYCVGLVDIDTVGLNASAEIIREKGGKALELPADVGNREAVTEAALMLEETYGPICVVAAAAAILPCGFTEEFPEAEWKRTLDVNLMGVINVDVVAAQSMIKTGVGGRIVNWSSVNALVSGPGFAAYATTKAALEMFSRCFAIELAPHGITVNCIRPGSIETPMMFDMNTQDIEQESARIPLGRWGQPKDTSAALRFLISEGASWITGTALTVDGGALASAGNPSPDVIQRRIDQRRKAEVEPPDASTLGAKHPLG